MEKDRKCICYQKDCPFRMSWQGKSIKPINELTKKEIKEMDEDYKIKKSK